MTEFRDQMKAEPGLDHFAICSWLVNVPTASLYPPEAEWYPDSPSDVYTEIECKADAAFGTDSLGRGWFKCENGHQHNAGAEYFDADEQLGGAHLMSANARDMTTGELLR